MGQKIRFSCLSVPLGPKSGGMLGSRRLLESQWIFFEAQRLITKPAMLLKASGKTYCRKMTKTLCNASFYREIRETCESRNEGLRNQAKQ